VKNAGNLTGRMGPRRPVTDEGAGAPTIAKAFSSPATGEKTRQLTVRVPESLHREVRAYALAHDLSVQDFVRGAVVQAMRA